MKKAFNGICNGILVISSLMLSSTMVAQDTAKRKPLIKLTGTMGITYEGYGLNVKPTGSNIYSPRKPWNQVRFLFNPVLQIGDKISIPLSMNFASIATNFAGPYAGLKNQTIGQFLTNPANNFSLNPKYKWAELLLGTQYIKYSDLSTGDIGIFGAGFNLSPGKFRLRFFSGISQQGINHIALPPPGTVGAFKRKHYMFQFGTEVEGVHKVAFTFSKTKDDINSVTSPPLTVLPQEGFTVTFLLQRYLKSGWFVNLELAQSVITKDLNQPLLTILDDVSIKPFINARTSSVKDQAAQFNIGKKSPNFDISYSTKYIGAGYQTTGYPFMQSDHWDNTLNTRLNLLKNKMNINASIGQRVNNLSNTSLRATQFLGNINWFTQVNDQLSINVNYNNFGFQTVSGLNPYGIKNVSNDFGISPTYTWTNEHATHLLSMNYNYSKYNERDVFTGITTSNNTHTVILNYAPIYTNRKISPDFSIMYFNNKVPTIQNRLLTLSSGLGIPFFEDKLQVKGQLQYTLGKLNSFTSNNNFILSTNIDYKINKKLTWNAFLSTNYFKYGNELGLIPLIGANYLESNLRTGLMYKF